MHFQRYRGIICSRTHLPSPPTPNIHMSDIGWFPWQHAVASSSEAWPAWQLRHTEAGQRSIIAAQQEEEFLKNVWLSVTSDTHAHIHTHTLNSHLPTPSSASKGSHRSGFIVLPVSRGHPTILQSSNNRKLKERGAAPERLNFLICASHYR